MEALRLLVKSEGPLRCRFEPFETCAPSLGFHRVLCSDPLALAQVHLTGADIHQLVCDGHLRFMDPTGSPVRPFIVTNRGRDAVSAIPR